jgi:hypothetical protein
MLEAKCDGRCWLGRKKLRVASKVRWRKMNGEERGFKKSCRFYTRPERAVPGFSQVAEQKLSKSVVSESGTVPREQ